MYITINNLLKIKMELKINGSLFEEFTKHDLHPGRMISGSKTMYRKMYPNNTVIFNGNIFTENRGKVWHGDLDLTRDTEKLERIANSTNEDLYILTESVGRWERSGRDELYLAEIKNDAIVFIRKT